MTLVLFKFTTAQAVVAPPIKAAPVKILWDASADPGVRGYAIYYGVVNSTATNRVDVGMNLSTTLTNLFYGANYFFYTVAYNSTGAESKASNTLLYAPPAITKLKLLSQTNGTMKINFRVAASATCRVQWANTAVSTQWTQLTQGTSDTNGYVTFSDPLIGKPKQRFYRAVVP